MAPPPKPGAAVQTIDPHGLFESRPTFSHVSTSSGASRIITTAGQVGADENGIVPASIDAQIQLAFTNLRRCLEAAGASVTDVLKLTYYIVNYNPKNRPHFKPLMEFLAGHRPATTLVGVSALAKPEFLFEVEAVAAVREEPVQSCDVVVVGAGLSGLQAAIDVQKAGLSCIVVEARDRVGGKTWSLDPTEKGAALDVGAAWINDTNQSKVYALAKAYGLKTVIQNTTGKIVQEDLDGSLSTFPYGSTPEKLCEEGGVANMVEVRNQVESLCQKIDIRDPTASLPHLDRCSVEELVKSIGGGPSAHAAIRVATRAMLGLEPSELSALFFLDYCKSGGGLLQMRADIKNGGQYMRLVEGTQSLSKCLASSLIPGSLLLNCPVWSIQQSPSASRDPSVLVSTGRGQFRCQRAIVSIPTPLYKDIAFAPPLPADKLALSTATKLGSTTKMLLVYASPWWRAAGLTGMLQSFTGPVSVTRDTSVDERGLYSLTCFVVGAPSASWIKLSEAERQEVVVDHVKKAFGPFVPDGVPEPTGAVHHVWVDDQWSQGCPCPVMPVGVMSKYGHALRTKHGRVHFVGTETAYEWKGYMDGALRSGERGADEVVKEFGRAKL